MTAQIAELIDQTPLLIMALCLPFILIKAGYSRRIALLTGALPVIAVVSGALAVVFGETDRALTGVVAWMLAGALIALTQSWPRDAEDSPAGNPPTDDA